MMGMEAQMGTKIYLKALVLGLALSSLGSSGIMAEENGSLRRFGAKVKIDGEQKGPLYAAGGEVVVSARSPKNARLMGANVRFLGRVGDDLWITGGDLDVSGEVGNHLHAWGAKTHLNGIIGGQASIMGADVVIGENAAITKGLHASGDKVVFKGAALGEVELEGREVEFAGSAQSNVSIRAPFVKIGDNARIKGHITIYTIGEPEISDRARIDGKVTIESLPQWEVMRRSHESGWVNRIAVGVLATLCAFLTGLLTISLARGGVEKTIDTLVEEPVRSALWGCVGLLCIPLIATFLILTVLGAPLAGAMMMTVPLILLLSITGSGFAIGEWIFNRAGDHVSAVHRAFSLLAGLLIIAILSLTPYVGGLILALAITLGAGALFLLFKDRFGEQATN